MIQGIIIEGLSTAGKTSLLSALKKVHSQTPNVQRTMISVSEHYSQVLHQDHGQLRSMQQNEHIELLKLHVDYLELLHNWNYSLGHTNLTSGVFYILERFHLNHRGAYGSSTEIEALEQRLSKLNAQCVLLTLSPDAVEPRFIVSRGEDWKSYILKDHSSVTEACEKFLADQEKLRTCAKQSLVPMMEINTDNAEWEDYGRQLLTKLIGASL